MTIYIYFGAGPKHGMGELSLCINQQPWNFYCGMWPMGPSYIYNVAVLMLHVCNHIFGYI